MDKMTILELPELLASDIVRLRDHFVILDHALFGQERRISMDELKKIYYSRVENGN